VNLIRLHDFRLSNRTKVRNKWKCRHCGLIVLIEQNGFSDLPPTPSETGRCEGLNLDEVLVVDRKPSGVV
jgi:hypothetical protein